MNIRLSKNVPQTIGGILILIILMCTGMFLYARWDLKRFKESLEEPSTVSPAAAPQTEEVINTHTGEAFPAETTVPKPLIQHNIGLESDGLEMETSLPETLDSPMDKLALFEEDSSETDTADVQREYLEEAMNSGSGLESLIPALIGQVMESGNSEDVATAVEILKRSAGGLIAVDDLITMTEALLRIEPDPQLQSMLLQLQNDKVKSLQTGKEITYTIDYTIEEQ